MAVGSVSGASDPYADSVYKPTNNSKNTLDIQSYIQLLAVQLQNQDVSNPMDSSEMMNQLTQMAMVQALSTMTETMSSNNAMNTTTYAAGLVGKGVTVAVTEDNSFGTETVVSKKYGVVETVDLSNGDPTFRLQGDSKDYPLSYLMGIGDITGDGASEGDEDAGAENAGAEEAAETSASRSGTPASKPPTAGEQSAYGRAVSMEERDSVAEKARLWQEEQLKMRLMDSLFSDGGEEDEDDSMDLSELLL